MPNRKNILFIARWYPDRNDPMLGLFVQKHATAVQLFHNVTVLYVTTDTKLHSGKRIIETTTFNGIREIKIYFGKHRYELSNAWAFLRNYLYGLRLAEKYSGLPDIVHVHILSRTAFPALWMKVTRGIPYFITEHWSRYLPENIRKGAYSGILRKWFTQFAVSRAEAVTTVTQNLANAMMAAGLKNKYFITPNVADINDFSPAVNPPENSVKKLVHVSCFDEPAKNIKGIINTVQKLARKRNDFIIDIVGDGTDYKMIEQYAAATGLINKRIFFTGLLTGSSLSDKMRNADLNVMFSHYENLPCTIVESLCCAVPVISIDVGGIREHVERDFGILIQAGNEVELETAIISALDHPEQFNKSRMRSYSMSHFSMQSIGKMFNDIYFTKLQ